MAEMPEDDDDDYDDNETITDSSTESNDDLPHGPTPGDFELTSFRMFQQRIEGEEPEYYHDLNPCTIRGEYEWEDYATHMDPGIIINYLSAASVNYYELAMGYIVLKRKYDVMASSMSGATVDTTAINSQIPLYTESRPYRESDQKLTKITQKILEDYHIRDVVEPESVIGIIVGGNDEVA
jgi:hypothetical protein